MLSPQEALLLQAARDEQARQESLQAAGLAGALGGATIGAAAGQVPHMVLKNTAGRLLNRNSIGRPGARMAGGLVGMILGGGLGAGMSAMMQRGSNAGNLLGKIQAQGGELSELDEMRYAQELGRIYQNPSDFM